MPQNDDYDPTNEMPQPPIDEDKLIDQTDNVIEEDQRGAVAPQDPNPPHRILGVGGYVGADPAIEADSNPEPQNEQQAEAPGPEPEVPRSSVTLGAMARRFTYHPPTEGQVPRYQNIRDEAQKLAVFIFHTTPKSREQSLAITKLEEAVFWANAAIARNE